MPVERFALKEGRYAMLAQADPARAQQLMKMAQADADARWQLYEQVAGVHRNLPESGKQDDGSSGAAPAASARRRSFGATSGTSEADPARGRVLPSPFC